MDNTNELHTYEITGYRKTEQIFRIVVVTENILTAIEFAKSRFTKRNCDLVEVEYVTLRNNQVMENTDHENVQKKDTRHY